MATGDDTDAGSAEYQLKKYLLLLATLVATVTYAAGLNLPGGTWVEDPPEGQLAGDSILRATNYMRYIVFFYFNAISFAASLLAGLLLLILHKERQGQWGVSLLGIVRAVMVAGLIGLTGAYAVGSSHDVFTTACGGAVLAVGAAVTLVSYVYYRFLRSSSPEIAAAKDDADEILLVLAIFAATIAYVAGLNPPGGFWRSSEEGHHTAGEPVLYSLHRTRYRAFFFLDTTAFTASLLAIMLIVSSRIPIRVARPALYGSTITALLGLGGAYTLGSCRDTEHTGYVVGLFFAVAAAFIFLHFVLPKSASDNTKEPAAKPAERSWTLLEKAREDIQLLAILAATIAYQAAVDPPGGVWVESGDGHKVGDPILLTTNPIRYKIFFYFNSAAFVASLVIMVMLQWEALLVNKHALEALMILDLFGLIGAFAAGGCRDASTSFYTVALAGAVLVYVVIHIVFFTVERETTDDVPAESKPPEVKAKEEERKEKEKEEKEKLQKKRDVLLLLAILGATLTYQAGLTPPGGCWEKDDGPGGHRAGFPVLLDKYPRRYKTFYYCNAAGFMSSVALIVLLLNHNMYKPGIGCYALYVCMVAGMLSLMGAYSAGSSFHLRTSIIVLVMAAVLAAACFAVAFYVYVVWRRNKQDKSPPNQGGDVEGGQQGKCICKHCGCSRQNEEEDKPSSPPAKPDEAGRESNKEDYRMYLMLVGILGASVTYITGLKPPGGVWREDGEGHAAGNPVLYDTSKTRYNAFFYSNSISFMASITIIAWLLSWMIWPRGETDGAEQQAAAAPHQAGDPTVPAGGGNNRGLGLMRAAMVVDMLALLLAYASGSARKWGTSTKVVLLLVPVLLFVWGVLFFNKHILKFIKGWSSRKEGS
ncbi:hypothetical protein U9M48_001467 [Paspalum notatum var. saurae]|uniref:PGG domain-containing protein n=1 Tax=Paspalum notatum var. saurae TaxID=547442 RepID=A0AAQ3SIC2_PASNO